MAFVNRESGLARSRPGGGGARPRSGSSGDGAGVGKTALIERFAEGRRAGDASARCRGWASAAGPRRAAVADWDRAGAAQPDSRRLGPAASSHL